MKEFWEKWTVDKPAAFGDLMWEVLVVQFAAFLDRLTLRQVIAVIPVVVVILAYAHSIPVPPQLMLVGDVLAYIDLFTVLLLVAAVSRAATIMFIIKAVAARAAGVLEGIVAGAWRLDVRHRREAGGGTRRSGQAGNRTGNEDADPAGIRGVAWA